MKQLFILMFFVFIVGANAQSTFNDVVYRSGVGNNITSCYITNIIDGNLVQYKKKGKFNEVRAVAIKKDGVYKELFPLKGDTLISDTGDIAFRSGLSNDILVKSDAYRNFESKYIRSVKGRSTGLVFMFGGIVLFAGSYVAIKAGNSGYIYGVTIIASFISFNIGAPIMISNSVKARRNLIEMEKLESQQRTKLSLGLTSNGMGLILKF